MIRRVLRRWLCVSVLLLQGGAFAQSLLPLAEVKPGQRGVAKTIFSGNTVEEFGIEVVDILHNFWPQRDLILVRLLGDKVQHTGVVAGMSGSPVYIDGKLLGAISYSLGLFAKEPIAGVTPIEAMLEVIDRERSRREEMAFANRHNPTFLDIALGLKEGTWENFLPPTVAAHAIRGDKASWLVPIHTPLILSGFSPDVVGQVSGLLEPLGFRCMLGGSSSSVGGDISPTFQPGDAIGGVLIDGDLNIAGVGTVTYVNGNHVLAFGHRFFESGPVTIAMGKAKILTTLSSLMASEKLPEVTSVVGTIRQDRWSGIYGVVGEPPPMTPVKVTYRSSLQSERVFQFRVAEDRSLSPIMPLFLRLALFNALESARLAGGDVSLRVVGAISLEGGQRVLLDNYFAGMQNPVFFSPFDVMMQATADVAAVFGALLANDFEVPKIAEMDLTFTATPGKRLAKIESVWYDKSEAEPGDSLRLKIFLTPYRATERVLDQVIQIPQELQQDQLTLFIGSGQSITARDRILVPKKFEPTDFHQLLDLLRQRRRNNTLYIQLRVRDMGALIKGEEMPLLPPSIMNVMSTVKTAGDYSPLREQLIGEYQIPTDYALLGDKTIRIKINVPGERKNEPRKPNEAPRRR